MKATPSLASSESSEDSPNPTEDSLKSTEDSLNPSEDSLADLLVLINSVRPHNTVGAYVQLVPVLLVVGLI